MYRLFEHNIIYNTLNFTEFPHQAVEALFYITAFNKLTPVKYCRRNAKKDPQ